MSHMPPPTSPTSGAQPHRGVLILVLGILSIVICAFIGPFAWMMGKGDLAKIDAGQMDREGRGLTQAGMICGIVGSIFCVLWILYILFIIVLMVIGAAGAAANP